MAEQRDIAIAQRLRRMRRLARPRVLYTLLLGLTEPSNDWHWERVCAQRTDVYFQHPVPWLTDTAVTFLDGEITTGTRVFEWGAGSSTLWFAEHGAAVVSYETESEWIAVLSPKASAGVDLRLINSDDDRYVVGAPVAAADIVLIDGFRRTECALRMAAEGAPGQLVILDDSHRSVYGEGVEALSARASAQWHFAGLQPMMTPKMTSVYRL